MVTDLSKFGTIGLLHFHKGISPSHVAEFPFQKRTYVYKDTIFVSEKKTDILILKVTTKNLFFRFALLFFP